MEVWSGADLIEDPKSFPDRGQIASEEAVVQVPTIHQKMWYFALDLLQQRMESYCEEEGPERISLLHSGLA